MIERYAIVRRQDGLVTGVALWDGVTPWAPEPGHRVVVDRGTDYVHETLAKGGHIVRRWCEPGDSHDGTTFVLRPWLVPTPTERAAYVQKWPRRAMEAGMRAQAARAFADTLPTSREKDAVGQEIVRCLEERRAALAKI